MIPGVNPSQARQLMKKMGIQQTDLDAVQVIIKLPDKELVFSNPEVAVISMQGHKTFQLTGDYEERVPQTDINDADIQAVIDQTQCDKQTAVAMLTKHNGDIAAAILEITENT